MVALTWGDLGQRFYETGIDRGVLFIDNVAVAWNGLTTVNETSTGGESNPFYADGLKYLNLSSREEYEATIEAWSSPPEFDVCLGKINYNGLILSGQTRKPFDFSYRTRIGNDLDGVEHGYKIHIVYGAMAKPSEVQNQTLNDSPEPVKYSWKITAMPQTIDGLLPSAHFTIDSRTISADLLADLEAVLYGSLTSDAYIPPASHFQNMIDSSTWIEIVASHDNGAYYTDELLRVHQSSDAPQLVPSGRNVIWLDMSGGDYATLKLVTGD
jgi:hypothetical protein